MRLSRASVLTLVVMGGASSLFADPIDPGVLFNKGGSHSTDITCHVSGCITPINDPIVNGGGTFDIHNKSGRNIIELLFFIPTVNFDQIFFATTNLFLSADISPDIEGQQTVVEFSKTGTGPDGTATIPPPSDFCGNLCGAGFENGQNGVTEGFNFEVEAIFGNPPHGADHPGLLNGEEGVLGLDPSAVPEPGSFVLLFSAAGVLLGGRKLYARRVKG